MSVSLIPNQAPPGTRRGSPIQIIDTFIDNGQTKSTCAVPVSEQAIPGQDCVVAIMGFAHDGFGHFLGSFTENPSPAFNNDANIQDAPPSNGTAQSKWFSRIVQPGDPGRDFNFQWSADVFVSWALIAYTLRFVDLNQIYDTGFFFNFSVGDIIFSSTLTGPYNTNTPNALIISQITAEAGQPTTGIGPGPLPGWYNTVDANKGQQPNIGLVSGIVDMPTPGRWIGASCAWSQGNPGSFGAPCDFAAITVAMRPMQAPGGPAVTISPSGSSIDTAGVSGVLFTVSWNYTPTGGQGIQNGWGIGRHVHGTGANTGYWNADTHTWQPTQYVNYGTRTSYTFSPGEWPNDGVNWDMFVFVQEASLNYLSALSTAKTFVASPPTATVTVTGPTGTTALPKPAVTWTRSLGSGATQAFYRVKVFTQAQTLAGGFDPNVTVPVVDSTKTAGSVLTWTLSKALVPGTYVAYVQLTTNFGQATLWTAGSPFTVAYSQPTAAGVTALVGAGP